jgi:hypothetical protein
MTTSKLFNEIEKVLSSDLDNMKKFLEITREIMSQEHSICIKLVNVNDLTHEKFEAQKALNEKYQTSSDLIIEIYNSEFHEDVEELTYLYWEQLVGPSFRGDSIMFEDLKSNAKMIYITEEW